MSKVGIIGGAGVVGATLAFKLALSDIVDEIVMLDIKENVLKGHVMDISQGISEDAHTVVRAGDWADLAGTDIVVMSASVPATKVLNRDDLLGANLGIVQGAAEHIAKYCPQAVVINATAPTDVFTYLFYKYIGGERRQYIGYNYNDTLRLKWAAAQVLKVSVDRVDAVVLGEHGQKQVPLYESICLDGQKVDLTAEQKQQISAAVDGWFVTYQKLDSGRTAGWTSTIGLEKIIHAMVTESDAAIPCSVIPDGEYGHQGTSIGLPVLLGAGGVKKIIEIDILKESKQKLVEAAEKITKMAQPYL